MVSKLHKTKSNIILNGKQSQIYGDTIMKVKCVECFNSGTTLSLHYFTSGSSCNWFVADVAKNMPLGLAPKSNLCSLFILCFIPYFFQDDSPPRLTLSPLTAPHPHLLLNILNPMV